MDEEIGCLERKQFLEKLARIRHKITMVPPILHNVNHPRLAHSPPHNKSALFLQPTHSIYQQRKQQHLRQHSRYERLLR